jgi:hypothetical protein
VSAAFKKASGAVPVPPRGGDMPLGFTVVPTGDHVHPVGGPKGVRLPVGVASCQASMTVPAPALSHMLVPSLKDLLCSSVTVSLAGPPDQLLPFISLAASEYLQRPLPLASPPAEELHSFTVTAEVLHDFAPAALRLWCTPVITVSFAAPAALLPSLRAHLRGSTAAVAAVSLGCDQGGHGDLMQEVVVPAGVLPDLSPAQRRLLLAGTGVIARFPNTSPGQLLTVLYKDRSGRSRSYVPLNWLADSGAGSSCFLDVAEADAMDLPLVDSALQIYGVGDAAPAKRSRWPVVVVLCKGTSYEASVLVKPIVVASRAFNGILGSPFHARLGASLDFARGRYWFHPCLTEDPVGSKAWVPLSTSTVHTSSAAMVMLPHCSVRVPPLPLSHVAEPC